MGTRIGTRLILGAGLVSALAIGLMAGLIMRSHNEGLVSQLTRNANQLGETIKSSTHYDMLENRRDGLHRQIRTMGTLRGEGIRKVRLFNKEGRIMFSSDSAEIGTAVDKRGEACYACHAEGRPLEKLDVNARARVYRDADGTRVLGIINPIPNEPSCYTADCHAHAASQRVLGVLDVNVSMAEADKEMARGRQVMAGFAALAILCSSLIIWWLNRKLVVRPVEALMEGTLRVAQGDLATVIKVEGHHELSHLAEAFNAMTSQISETRLQLTQADKLASVGRLAAGIAHEINNPLTGVLTYASLMAKRLPEGDPNAEDVEVIVRETKRCRAIIKELLDFARPAPPSRRPTDLNEVVRHSLAVVMNQLSLNHINLALDLAQDLPEAYADGNQVQQIAVNLLLNAADVVQPGTGQIRLATRVFDDAFVELQVTDNGSGIAPEDLPHLFEPFFSTKGNRGTGLGLAVTWGIVESHGGSIDVQTELGKGTTFSIRIPILNPEAGISPS
ncbi:sensor histidine kinase [Geothrix sp. 21YS21S-2]|uniref:sensor histidine kinase n=1 Tax=Geothrix sp. 21YS21S-2 TaxID=3068893 RepID=UPI0027B8C0B3|nr:HAMP domain-containing sensor histidine kinase [Geothrix sp. 21YS21S-2]